MVSLFNQIYIQIEEMLKEKNVVNYEDMSSLRALKMHCPIGSSPRPPRFDVNARLSSADKAQ